MGILSNILGGLSPTLKLAKFQSFAFPAIKHYTKFDAETLPMKLQNELSEESINIIGRLSKTSSDAEFTACFLHLLSVKSPFRSMNEAADFFVGYGVFISHFKKEIDPKILKEINMDS